MIGSKKGIYHSTLSAFGPAFVTVKTDVLPSKNGGHFIVLEHEGTEQYYNVENERCGLAFKGLKGQQVTVKATGGREDANIEISGGSPSVSSPAPSTPAQPAFSAEQVATQAGAAIRIALAEARKILDANADLSPEQFQAITSSIFIHMDKRGVIPSLGEQKDSNGEYAF